jgi:positive regulator of sigma E activity
MKLNYDLLWVIYFIAAGLATYYIFETDILYIVFAIIAVELSYFLVFRTKWNFIKRYLFNLFYVMGYVVPLVFS